MRRLLLAGFAGPMLAAALLLVPGSPARPGCAYAAGTHHVAVVVQHGGGATLTRCVAFMGDTVKGNQVMGLSAIEYATASYGGLGSAVCQVDYEPSTYPPGCWTSNSNYWGMFVSRAGGAWRVSNLGIDGQVFADGDALGWHYIPQSGPGGGPPPSPAGACQPVNPPPAVVAQGPPAQAPAPASGSGTPVPELSQVTVPEVAATAAPLPLPPVEAAAATPPPVTAAPITVAAPTSLRRAATDGPSAGWIATAAGGGVLVGLLILRVAAVLLRR